MQSFVGMNDAAGRTRRAIVATVDLNNEKRPAPWRYLTAVVTRWFLLFTEKGEGLDPLTNILTIIVSYLVPQTGLEPVTPSLRMVTDARGQIGRAIYLEDTAIKG